VTNRIVDGETISYVATGTIDVERDRPAAVAREFSQLLDAIARDVLFDVSDKIRVTQPLVGLLA
jgi:hypothetical protein